MPVRLGLVGAGQIAQFHADAIAANGSLLAAVADPDETRGRSLARRAGATYCADAQVMLADPEIQAVVIATPNSSHYGLARAALDAGKDILCEKPMTTSAAESAELVRAVQALPDVIFQVGYMKRFNPGFQLLRDTLPEIGELLAAEVRVLAEWRPAPTITWYRQPHHSGGGILVHSGSHLIDVVRFLFGEPVRVDARVRFAPDVPDLDQATQALIDLESGLSVQFAAISTPASGLGHAGEGWEETVDVIGSEGRLRLSSPNWQATAPCAITLQRHDEQQTRTRYATGGNPWEAEMHAFLHAVETRSPATPDVIDGYRVDAILAAIYASARQRTPVDVPVAYDRSRTLDRP